MFDHLAAMILFVFTASVTPGPNNVMLMTSGVNFGFRQSIPHLLGVALGFTLMVALCAVGIASALATHPAVERGMTVIGAVYLLYLGLRIALAPVRQGLDQSVARTARKPLGFLGAAAFQWVNPKAWTMMIGFVSTYVPLTSIPAVLAAVLVCGLITSVIWVGLGTRIVHLLDTPRRLKTFNVVMGVLLILSLAPVLPQVMEAARMLRGG